MVQAYWQVGRLIVEHEQGGRKRATYGESVLGALSQRLTTDFGKGFTRTNLKYMRSFYVAFPIGHALRDQSAAPARVNAPGSTSDKDHFITPTEFEWQSQNRTSRSNADGQDIQSHAMRGIAVHLFVRSQKKRAGGGAAPFVYCGDVEFVGWRGEKPITVQWTLPEAVPARLRGDLTVPDVPRPL